MVGASLPPGGVSIVRILTGLFRIKHLKQFISFGISVCFILWILRVLRLMTLLIIVLACSGAIIILTFIEYFLGRNRRGHEQERLLSHRGHTSDFPSISADEKCRLCGASLRPGDEIAFTPCRHAFHQRCFDKWCIVKTSCPVCESPGFDIY
jgi:hypothetical protein